MIGIVFNPNSRKNRKRPERLADLVAAVGDNGEVIRTDSTADIAHALHLFTNHGHPYWLADGGDGALHWLVNTAVETFGEDVIRERIFIPTSAGSVDFLAHALGLRGTSGQIVRRLRAGLDAGKPPTEVPVQSVLFEGTQRTPEGERPFRKLGFGNSLAGYGANFFGPLHEGDGERTPTRIAGLMATAFGAAAGRAVLRGPLERLKPDVMRKAEHDFLRTLHAEVRINGELLRDDAGRTITEHTVIQCASVPLHIAGILRVFPKARVGRMHVQAGMVTAIEMARIFPRLMTGRSVHHLLPAAWDDEATSLDVRILDDATMSIVLDGEIYEGIRDTRVSLGPVFRFAAP